MNIGSRCLRGSPFSLSNNRGHEITVTNMVTVRPGVVIFSRPATNLSPRNERRVVGIVGRCHGTFGTAIMVVSRDVRSVTRVTSGLLILSGNRIIVFSGARGVFTHNSRLHTVKLGIPVIAHIFSRLHRGKLGIPDSIFAMDHTIRILGRLGTNSRSTWKCCLQSVF